MGLSKKELILTLQHNFDIIQYLIDNASTEQLTWQEDEHSWSLSEIVRHLYKMEIWHKSIEMVDTAPHNFLHQTHSPTTDKQTFEAYTHYRQETINLLQTIPAAKWQQTATHKRLGKMVLAKLIEKIGRHDRTHIQQIEKIFAIMPLNPLLTRALYEIREYHLLYQPYLVQATSLLDIGVGTGLVLQHIIEQNPHLTCAGVDVRDLRLPHADVPLHLYDGYILPYKKKQFDVSLFFYVLHHCYNPQKILGEAVRVTRQKVIIIEEFNCSNVDKISLDLTERQSHKALGIPPDLPYQLFGKTEFEQMLKAEKLIEVEQRLLPSKTTRPVQKYLYVVDVM